ncbi:universal stress protein [Streptomyces sp. NPDC048506]|uniref:universal stress protein n=1 Tax=Streptomyces sp. NPDC048506 TaxID=3155028 RepID=UPI003440E009
MAIPLVVGIDGSEASLEAVDWAADEAVRHEVPLHLVHAAAPNHEASGLIAAASERARKSAPGIRLSSEVLHQDAASALVGKGRNALALVLGSRGLGDLAGLLLGSVSLAVAARADCPVVVVRGGAEYRNARFGSVGVGVGVEDGEGSGTAVRFAFREAHLRRCRLVAVHAWSAPVGYPEPVPLSGYALEAHRRPPEQVLDDALRGSAERYRHVPSGADLLIVGARRRRGHVGLQLGLVNHAVLHHAPCPIAVVPQR